MQIKHQCSYILLIPLLLALPGCKPKDQLSLSLYGKANYSSPLFQPTDSFPVSNKIVQATDLQTGFIYPLVTDQSGIFALPGWQEDKTFQVELKLLQNDSDEYKAVYGAVKQVTGVNINKASLTARIDTANYNALLLSVKDNLGGKIPSSKVFIYSSRIIAAKDTGFVGFNAIATLSANAFGTCLAMQLPADSLFVKSYYKADTVINLRSAILGFKFKHRYLDTSIVVQ